MREKCDAQKGAAVWTQALKTKMGKKKFKINTHTDVTFCFNASPSKQYNSVLHNTEMLCVDDISFCL